MFKQLRFFKSTRYLVQTALYSALLVVLSLLTFFIKINGSSFQIADGVFLALIAFVPGPMLLVVGIIYPLIFDLLFGGFVYIPASIVIHILIFCLVKVLKRPFTSYGAIVVSEVMIFLYVLYTYLINLSFGQATAGATAMTELSVDAIQYGISVLIGCSLYFVLSRPGIKQIFKT